MAVLGVVAVPLVFSALAWVPPHGVELMALERTAEAALDPAELATMPPEPLVLAPDASVAAPPVAIANTQSETDEPAALQSDAAAEPAVTRTFNGRPIRPVRTLEMLVTAYSPDERSCGKWADGITASGYSVWTHGMKLVAADTNLLPFETIVSVPGYNGDRPVPVLDRGGKIKGHRLDVLYPTHEIATQWGRKTLEVTVWEYAD